MNSGYPRTIHETREPNEARESKPAPILSRARKQA
jgi:hypothetical protein